MPDTSGESSEEGLTELRIRRSYGPTLFADLKGETLPAVDCGNVERQSRITKSEQLAIRALKN